MSRRRTIPRMPSLGAHLAGEVPRLPRRRMDRVGPPPRSPVVPVIRPFAAVVLALVVSGCAAFDEPGPEHALRSQVQSLNSGPLDAAIRAEHPGLPRR